MKTNRKFIRGLTASLFMIMLAPLSGAQQQPSLIEFMDADHSTAIAQANEATESAAASTTSRILSGEQAQNSVEQKHFRWAPEDFVCKENVCTP